MKQRFKIVICSIFIVASIFPIYSYSQNKYFHIEKPTVTNNYKYVKDVLLIAEKDSIIGKFTTDFIGNLSENFVSNGIKPHAVFKTTNDKYGIIPAKVDSIKENFDPHGLIILSLKRSTIGKTSTFGNLVPCLVFRFQYSYRINDNEDFIHMFLTDIIIDLNGIQLVGIPASEKILKIMRKKKIIE